MPSRFAMVAERRIATGPQTLNLRTCGVTRGDHREAAVRRRTPACVDNGLKNTSNHELLVFPYEIRLMLQYARDVRGMDTFGTLVLWTIQRDTTLCDLQFQVTSQARLTKRVRTQGEVLELFR